MPRTIYILLLLLFIKDSTTAQYKIGIVNTNAVFNKMIQEEKLNDILRRYQDSLFKVANKKEEEFNKQQRDELFSCDDCPPLPDSVKRKKRQQLIEQVTAISNSYDLAETLSKKKSEELMNPLRQRLKDSVRQIAAENKYYYVLDISDEHLSFLPLPPYDDITDIVLCKLGL